MMSQEFGAQNMKIIHADLRVFTSKRTRINGFLFLFCWEPKSVQKNSKIVVSILVLLYLVK